MVSSGSLAEAAAAPFAADVDANIRVATLVAPVRDLQQALHLVLVPSEEWIETQLQLLAAAFLGVVEPRGRAAALEDRGANAEAAKIPSSAPAADIADASGDHHDGIHQADRGEQHQKAAEEEHAEEELVVRSGAAALEDRNERTCPVFPASRHCRRGTTVR